MHRAAGAWNACHTCHACHVVSCAGATKELKAKLKKSVEKCHVRRTGRSGLFSKGCGLKSKQLLPQCLGTYLMSYQSDRQHQNIWILSAVPG